MIAPSSLPLIHDAIFMGYPSSKNELVPRDRRNAFRIYSFRVKKSERLSVENSSLRTSICFDYPKMAANTSPGVQGRLHRTPNPNGISGGPVFSIDIDKRVFIVGVAIERDERQTILTATPMTRVIEYLNDISMLV